MKFKYVDRFGETYEYESLEDLLYNFVDNKEVNDYVDDCYGSPELPILGKDYNLAEMIFSYDKNLYDTIVDDYINNLAEIYNYELETSEEGYIDFKDGRIFITE